MSDLLPYAPLFIGIGLLGYPIGPRVADWLINKWWPMP